MPSTRRAPTVFFLSDYGTRDEFVGVVHAVLAAASPGVTVIDLTHHIPAFDVRAGSRALVRAAPHLGPGVVLAVVDPGVGSLRRALCLPVTRPGGGPTFFVGPDNGLLVAAAELLGGAPLSRAFALHGRRGAGKHGPTFDGRDLFAPAAAALSDGLAPEELGAPVDPASLVRLAGAMVEFGAGAGAGAGAGGRQFLRAEVLWVDRFGNIQLAASAADARAAALPRSGKITLHGPDRTLRWVGTFDELVPGELGLLVDANGQLAVVAGQASASAALGASAGDTMLLTW